MGCCFQEGRGVDARRPPHLKVRSFLRPFGDQDQQAVHPHTHLQRWQRRQRCAGAAREGEGGECLAQGRKRKQAGAREQRAAAEGEAGEGGAGLAHHAQGHVVHRVYISLCTEVERGRVHDQPTRTGPCHCNRSSTPQQHSARGLGGWAAYQLACQL